MATLASRRKLNISAEFGSRLGPGTMDSYHSLSNNDRLKMAVNILCRRAWQLNFDMK